MWPSLWLPRLETKIKPDKFLILFINLSPAGPCLKIHPLRLPLQTSTVFESTGRIAAQNIKTPLTQFMFYTTTTTLKAKLVFSAKTSASMLLNCFTLLKSWCSTAKKQCEGFSSKAEHHNKLPHPKLWFLAKPQIFPFCRQDTFHSSTSSPLYCAPLPCLLSSLWKYPSPCVQLCMHIENLD